MKQGKFIIVEGGDGAGKTTFVNTLRENQPLFVYSREPGGQGFSQKIRELVLSDEAKDADHLAMFCLFWASRAQNISSIVIPALNAGKVVVSDRFDASTYAFQIGKNPNLEDLFWQTRATCLQGIEPVYLDFRVSVEEAERRMNDRGEKNHFDRRSSEERRQTRSFYDKFFSKDGVKSIRVNANLSMDRMLSRAMGALESALGM
ncbi:MAG TPA: dTMP kinase [Candidatus Paceibacterota bacterium]